MLKRITATSLIAIIPVFSHAADLGTFNGTNFQVGGYIKTKGIFSDPDSTPNTFDMDSRQSRINFKTSKVQDGHKLSGYIEGDFYGANGSNTTSDWRLRHAMFQIDNIQIGQYWSAQTLGFMASDLMDFFEQGRGTISKANFRPNLIHYNAGGLRLSAQDPIYSDAGMPDLAANYRKTFSNGNVLGALVSVREMSNDDVVAGVAVSGKIKLGDDDIRFNAHYGDGWAGYTGVGSDIDGNNDAISQYGGNISYRHVYNSNNRSTVQYTQTMVDDSTDTEYKSVHVNFIHTLVKDVDIGVEWRQYEMSPATTMNGEQVEVMAMYKF